MNIEALKTFCKDPSAKDKELATNVAELLASRETLVEAVIAAQSFLIGLTINQPYTMNKVNELIDSLGVTIGYAKANKGGATINIRK